MNTRDNKGIVIFIAAIMAAAASALFLIVKITPLFIVAYLFALVGIAGFCMGNLYLLAHTKSYPWFAAFPMTIWQYLVAESVLSAVFIIRENLFNSSLSVSLFVVLHIALIAFFAVFLLLIKGSKGIIENRDAQVKEKVAVIRFMQADIESLMRQFPGYAKDLKQIAEAIRYSDPMSHPSLAVFDERIQRGITSMSALSGEGAARIPEICAELLRQIADRNSRVKMMK